MGTTLYLTALALDAVTSIGINLSVVVTAAACTLYTTLVNVFVIGCVFRDKSIR